MVIRVIRPRPALSSSPLTSGCAARLPHHSSACTARGRQNNGHTGITFRQCGAHARPRFNNTAQPRQRVRSKRIASMRVLRILIESTKIHESFSQFACRKLHYVHVRVLYSTQESPEQWDAGHNTLRIVPRNRAVWRPQTCRCVGCRYMWRAVSGLWVLIVCAKQRQLALWGRESIFSFKFQQMCMNMHLD